MEPVENQVSLSVLIATYNRADVLRQTLKGMCAVEREGLDVEFVVIDNNSGDDTSAVIDSFKDRLPIRHLFQPRQGKSAALNLALDTVELGEIVAFTDDDVVSGRDWLKRVAWSCATWSEYSVFGGELYNTWPEDTRLPSWVRNPEVARKFFGTRESLGRCIEYPENQLPTGANFWVRKAVIQQGFRFDELLGAGDIPRTGEDTVFLRTLRSSGFPPFFVTDAGVGHLIQASRLRKSEVRRLAFRRGRSEAYKQALQGCSAVESACSQRAFRRMLSVGYRCVIAWSFSLPMYPQWIYIKNLRSWWNYGYATELLRLSRVHDAID